MARRGTSLKAGIMTWMVSLLSFGLAHAAFITPLVERDPNVPLWMLLGLMLGAPMMIGALPALVGSLLAAAAWHATRERGRLPPWRFGAALAAGLVPALVISHLIGPLGDRTLEPAVVVAMFGSLMIVPAIMGVWAGGARAACFMALAVLPTGILNTMFFVGGDLDLWTGSFLLSILAIWTVSGVWMDLFVRRVSRRHEQTHALMQDVAT